MTPIADFDERRPAGESKFRKTEYMKLKAGEHTVRFAQEKAEKQYAHWIIGAYIECLGDNCPVCENNKQIIYENPKDFRNVAGYSYKRERFAINLIDKTEGDETVKVLTGGRTLFEDIDVIAQATRTDAGEPVDLRAYDWKLIVTGEGRDRTINLIPQYRGNNEPVIVEESELFNAGDVVIKLNEEEMNDALRGVALKDIFAMRRAQKEVVEKVGTDAPSIVEDVEKAVDSIFKSA